MISALLLAAVSWTAPVELQPPAGTWAAAAVPGWLERRTSGNLARIQLLDDRGHEVPYRLLDTATDLATPWRAVVPRNLRRTADGFAAALELTPAEPIDALEITFNGDGGVLAVAVEAGTPAGVLVADARLGRLQGVDVRQVDLPVTDAPRLELRLTTLVPGLEPATFRVRRTLRPKRLHHDRVRFRAAPIPGDGETDRWRLAATAEPTRIDGLVLEIDSPAVLRRRATVLSPATDTSRATVLGGCDIARLPLADGRRGIEALRVPLQPGAWRELEVAIERGGEARAELRGAEGDAARRWLVFPRPASDRGLHLEPRAEPRSDTLERGPLPVHPDDATPASIGPPAEQPQLTPTPASGVPSTAVSLLFVAVAVLLGLLAWRVLRTAR